MPETIVPSTIGTARAGKVRLIIAPQPGALGFAAADANNIETKEAAIADTDAPWQAAYQEFALRGGNQYVEAELQIPMPAERIEPPVMEGLALGGPSCDAMPQSAKAPRGPEAAWHLGDRFSQLAAAREFAKANNSLGRPVRIAHIDTGYFNGHSSLPTHLLKDLGRDFTVRPPRNSAEDPGGFGPPIDNRGHGTATLAILGAGKVKIGRSEVTLGGAPDAEVLPLRVCDRVVLVGIDALAKAVHYAIDNGVDIITMSMGGVASKLWLDSYNRAYENGVFCVCAAGNHLKLGRIPTTPTGTVYPALFNRVLSATGVMADGSPYDLPGTMSGNWGPHDKMRTSLAAYTPNIPWAEWGCDDIVSEDGAGTSSATPQIAAAAALWLQVHGSKFGKDWRRTESLRQALLQSAKLPGSHFEEFGRGILQARAALNLVPQAVVMEPADIIWHPWLKTLTGLGLDTAEAPVSTLEQMLHVEFAQLAMTDPGLISLIKPGMMAVPNRLRDQVREYVIEQSKLASPQLKLYLRTGEVTAEPPVSQARAFGVTQAEEAPSSVAPVPQRQRWQPTKPETRRLRVYALDPSYDVEQSTVSLARMELEIPWDEKLKPGPVDEYLEVIDFDPSTGCLYEPVDLDNQLLLAQNGLPPSPSNPMFHQQMVYAVARKTIDIFETALGRRMFWTGPPLDFQKRQLENPPSEEELRRFALSADDDTFVQRLRIYPHAMRQRNAFYSQRKGALLFGYFESTDEDRFGQEIVYACLSYDIVAHETTHAILDGINRTLIKPTNPDVLAFHEAFADIVALLSRFQMTEIVAAQIRSTRGDLNSANILGQLGREFGKSTGRYQGLRMYLGRSVEEIEKVTQLDPISRYATDQEVEKALKDISERPAYRRKTVWQKTVPDPRKLKSTGEAHQRGAILVAAVYGALVAIYEARASRLLRLVRPGEDPPSELLDLLTSELTKSAAQVLNMCIRAIDYLPPTDITFGDYLRAILTADYDLVKQDKYYYRLAIIESFRNWGIKVDGIRNSSEESLRWPKLHAPQYEQDTDHLAAMLAEFVREDFQYSDDRRESFRVTAMWRSKIHDWLKEQCKAHPGFEALLCIDAKQPFYVRALRRVERAGLHGRPLPQAVLRVTQTIKISENGRPRYQTSGCSLIVNTTTKGIDYLIMKKKTFDDTSGGTTAFAEPTLRTTYFGNRLDVMEPFAVLHSEEGL